MEFNYLTPKDSRNLIKDLFVLKFTKNDLPFETIIIPLGLPVLAYISSNEQTILVKGVKNPLKGLTLFGQFYGAYNYAIKDETTNVGFHLNPTSLYKILNQDISLFTNKRILLEEVNNVLAKKLEPIFLSYKHNEVKYKQKVIECIDNLILTVDKDVIYIEKAIDYIQQKEGIVKVKELLNIVPFSQKSLETKFKKIVGLTPIQFIKMIRFNQLIIKYQIQKKDIRDLLHMYNYYDQSHFNRDFKLMMNQSSKHFFKKEEYPFLDQYLAS